MHYKFPVGITICTVALLSAWTPEAVTVHASSYPMRHTQIDLNSKTLSAPSGFTYQDTTYMPLYYVQQLLNKLQIQNHWDGDSWHITTPFDSQPLSVLKTVSGSMGIIVNNKTFAAYVNKIVTVDPASNDNTTYIPIWYFMQTLQSIGLQSTWNGTTWSVLAAYTDVTKNNSILGSFTNLNDAKSALLDYPGGKVLDLQGNPIFTEASFLNVDLRYGAPGSINASSLNQYLSNHNSIMSGLGQTFMDAQTRYGVDANYLVSHAIEETGSGGNVSQIALDKNNLYGYGAFDNNAYQDAGTFPSESYAILFQAWEVRNNYLNEGASHYVAPTLTGMSASYASDPQWATNINNLMDQLAIDTNDNVTSYTQYSQNNQPSVPANAVAIPEYDFNGAYGLVHSDPFYGSSIPVYSDSGTGHQHMFVRNLQTGDSGDDVQTLQQALNTLDNANLKPDGIFGPATVSAVEAYQSAHGLTKTGVCDFALWNNALNLSDAAGTINTGQKISIDAIVEGMAGSSVTEWYHIPNIGFVNAQDVNLTNVYRLNVPNPKSAADVSIPVTDSTGKTIATLHAGDYVVSNDTNGLGNKITIQFCNQDNQTAMTGAINTNTATLVQVNH